MDWILPSLLALAFVLQLLWHQKKRAELRDEIADLNDHLSESNARMSRELAAAAERQATLFDRMIEGVLILDGGGRVQLINATTRKLFGLDLSVRGKRLLEAIRSHELHEIVMEVEKSGHVLGREMIIKAGLETRCLSLNASSFGESGSGEGVIVVLHDLTKLKAMEKGRREFVANVSHELRTPLSMIKGYVETLLQGEIGDPMIRERFLGKIQKHSDRLTYLIEDLLAISQLESNQIAVSFARVPLRNLVDRAFDDLHDRAMTERVKLESSIAKELRVYVDPDRMQQVLQNLVDNGIKYGGRDGTVSVEAELREDCWVVVRVGDNGPGIPEEMHDRVFERFFRVDKARSREQGGTGLGLAIVKHIIQSHGGQVWLESGSESGAVFSFTIPTEAME